MEGSMLRSASFLAASAALSLACRTAHAPPTPAQAPDPGAPAPRAADAAAAPSAPGPADAAFTALAEGRLAEAEALFVRALAAAPGDARIVVGLARAQFALSRPAEALATLERALSAGDSAEARALRGRQLSLARRFEEALPDLERAVALAPGAAAHWCTLAAVQVNRGDDVEAQLAFDRAAALLGRRDAAERCWTELLAVPPDPRQPQESLDRSTRGRIEFLVPDWGAGWREFLVAVRYSREYQWAIAGVAEGTWRMGDVALAERLFRQAIGKFPESLAPLRADAQGKLAALLVQRGEAAAEARGLALAALAIRPERAHLLETLARACDQARDAECARDAYGRLLRRPRLADETRRAAEERLAALGAATASAR
jgi:tetratricopeptide (TPR) repeat protein